MVALLKLENELVISYQTFLGVRLLLHAGIKVKSY